MSLSGKLKELFRDECRFSDRDHVCTLNGYRCSGTNDYRRCGIWKNNVLGPVQHGVTERHPQAEKVVWLIWFLAIVMLLAFTYWMWTVITQ